MAICHRLVGRTLLAMELSKPIAINIAHVLNKRGFVTHDDFGICTDDLFGSFICSQEHLLRDSGYAGGRLKSWSTSFRLSSAYTYGVMDSDNPQSNEHLDAYTLATNELIEESGLLVFDLPSLLLGLQYQCECGQIINVANSTIPYRSRGSRIHTISCLCAACKRRINAPQSTYRLFAQLS